MDIFLALTPAIVAFITVILNEVWKLSISAMLVLILSLICVFFLVIKTVKRFGQFDWKYFIRFVVIRSLPSIVLGLLATYVYTTDSYINVFLIGYIISYVTSVHLTSVKDISKLLGE
ncbi:MULTISPECIES: hypothetical protein [Thermoanaerobacterium]|uniref:Uncharacterized protein n=3 Tax=Thermoanaerobacterium TaxID=28895 RepID=L0IQ78_THETR|nr:MULTISPECIES: hypothetical protein [Thermoanaerobacterium]AFK94324.1 hypothetical protein Tsac_2777 [Thermoanaerobacterium saccharolyticum JW/SL-YS485]AGB20361.1 hypothetical protein Thethe_02808 [Thermoanaerobacterium thermosaccharolyticum M0795]ETO39094.1 hypothetical protein V518_0682 [Thermoanaerobacterium aotearoense SCUT27]